MLPLLLPLWLVIIGIMAILAAGCVVGFFLGESHRKKVAEAKIGSAEEEARRLVNDAVKTAQQKRKEEEEAKKAEGHSEQSVPEAPAEDTVPGHGNEAEQSGGAEKKDE